MSLFLRLQPPLRALSRSSRSIPVLRHAPLRSVLPATSRAPALPQARHQSTDIASDVNSGVTNVTNGSHKLTPDESSLDAGGLRDIPTDVSAVERVDWASSFKGLSQEPFPAEVSEVLMREIDPEDIEVKPDGIIYLPEIKYRRILNKAFGPGGWGLAPRGETIVTEKLVTREYALVCMGRLVSIARGEQEYFDRNGISMATEGAKSNALMRTCKDLGIASELWDPRFVRKYKRDFCVEKFAEHVTTKKRKKVWLKKGENLEYPWKATTSAYGSS